jgi:hypothetical protein
VVIAIIAILASLPAARRGQDALAAAPLHSQMKQLGLAFSMFASDHDDRYPPTAYSTGDYQYLRCPGTITFIATSAARRRRRT